MADNLLLVVTRKEAFFKGATNALSHAFSSSVECKRCFVEEFIRQFDTHKPFAVLIDLGNPELSHEVLLTAIKHVQAASDTVKIICAAEPNDASLVLRLVRMGIKDFLSYPFVESEIQKLSDEMFQEMNQSSLVSKSKLITFFSPKGGTGVTLLTANTAVALAEDRNCRVAAVDLSYQCGDVATYLNVPTQYTFRDVIDNHALLDSSFLSGVLSKHSSGVHILGGPKETQDPADENHMNILRSLLSFLKSSFNYVLVDGGRLNRTLLHYVMSESDMIFLIANPDVVSLKGLVSYFNQLKLQHYDPKRIKVVINRFNSKNQIDSKEFEKITKHTISFFIPNNYTQCIDAVNQGVPLKDISEKSDLTRKIQEIAAMIRDAESKSGTASDKGFDLGAAIAK